MDRETYNKNGYGKLIEEGKIMRGITENEGAYMGLDTDIVQFLNILAEGQIRTNQLEKRLKEIPHENQEG